MSLVVRSMRVGSFSLSFLDIRWEIAPLYDDIENYQFYVEKASREHGPYQKLVGPLVNVFRVRDGSVSTTLDHYRDTFYRLRIVNISENSTSYYPTNGRGVRQEALPTLEALEIARQENIRLRHRGGRKLWVFPRRKFGARCSCYDSVMRKRLVDSCLTCFNTTWIGGFESPIEVYGQVVLHRQKTEQVGVTENSSEVASIKLPHYPIISDGDVIIEAENKRWRVAGEVFAPEHYRFPVRQEARCFRISEGDIEYSIPLNAAFDPVVDLATPGRALNSAKNSEADRIERTSLGILAKYF